MSPEQSLTVDFAALAIADEDFAKFYRANDGYVDFQDPETVQFVISPEHPAFKIDSLRIASSRQLTKSILKRDFKLEIELPTDRLCPPVPVRFEYIRWLQGLIDTTGDDFSDSYDPERDVVGIDIGVGASCIYPLLGCASRTKWRFGGTELDEKSFDFATRNVALNKLQSRIRLRKTNSSNDLLNLTLVGIKQADFVMCNPPFFTSKQDMLATHVTKKRLPSAVCTGADVEMVTEGGDLGFVMRLIEESKNISDQIQWYSSMLGKLSSVHAVVAELKERKITNWAVTSLQAGNVTRRWVVAWSYGDMRPRNDIARGGVTTKDILPFPTEFGFTPNSDSTAALVDRLSETMNSLDAKWKWNRKQQSGTVVAKRNTWSRSARRKRQKEKPSNPEEDEGSDSDVEEAALGARISFAVTGEILVRWLKGSESVIFESFCGMLKRTLTLE